LPTALGSNCDKSAMVIAYNGKQPANLAAFIGI
jgi:hypothetical protein